MPGMIVDLSATVTCSHSGSATPTAPSGRVSINGQPVVTLSCSYTIASCSFYPPYGNGPCVNGQFIQGAARVSVEGQPVVLMDSQSTCTPTGTPLIVAVTQQRVSAT